MLSERGALRVIMSIITRSFTRKATSIITALFIAVFFTGCAETELASHVIKQTVSPPTSKSIGYFKVGKPYKIKGRRYYPKESYGLVETGMASWYGPGFHGKMTANGEIFNQGDLTAAHRTLQLPSIVKVTNLRNGRSIIVRVNDRGPFAHERVIDLSEKAAILLGFKNQGITKVKLEVLGKESRMVAQAAKQGRDTRGVEVALNRNPPAPKAKPLSRPSVQPHVQSQSVEQISPIRSKYYVQAGAFGEQGNAERFSQILSGLSNTNVVSNNGLYKVRLGPVRNEVEANNLLALVEERSRSKALIIKE